MWTALDSLLFSLQGGLIVSCQALDGEPLFGPGFMAAMAVAAEEGGAVGLRANGASDIYAIKQTTTLPVIGIYKREYHGFPVYITPTMAEIDTVIEAGADIVATDATHSARPDGQSFAEFVAAIRKRHKILIMGDVSTLAEGVDAVRAGVDLVSTTLSGYTPYSNRVEGPDFALLQGLVNAISLPVIAEGRISSPAECKHAFDLGAFATVVGTAITRPQEIVRRFAAVTPHKMRDRKAVDTDYVRHWG